MTRESLLRYAVLAAGGWLHAAAVAWPLHSLWTYGQNIWYLQVAAMLVLAQQLLSAPRFQHHVVVPLADQGIGHRSPLSSQDRRSLPRPCSPCARSPLRSGIC